MITFFSKKLNRHYRRLFLFVLIAQGDIAPRQSGRVLDNCTLCFVMLQGLGHANAFEIIVDHMFSLTII